MRWNLIAVLGGGAAVAAAVSLVLDLPWLTALALLVAVASSIDAFFFAPGWRPPAACPTPEPAARPLPRAQPALRLLPHELPPAVPADSVPPRVGALQPVWMVPAPLPLDEQLAAEVEDLIGTRKLDVQAEREAERRGA